MEEKKKTNWRRLIVVMVLALFGITFLVVVGADVRQGLMQHRWEVGCEDGNVQACGFLALPLLRDAPTYQEKVTGMEYMQRPCDQNYPGGCRMAATFGQRRVPAFGGNTIDVIQEHRNAVVYEKCMAGDGKACFVIGQALYHGHFNSREEREALLKKSAELCLKESDAHACFGASSLAFQLHEDMADIHWKACELGFASGCVRGAEIKPPTPEQSELAAATCKTTQSALACRHAGDEDFKRKQCWNGDFMFCKEVDYDKESEHAKVYEAFYPALSKLQTHDFVGYSYGMISDDFMDECRNGMAEACFLMGVRLVSDYHKDWSPKRKPVEQFEYTFGQACELGMNAGCLAFGIEMLNRAPGKQEIKRANAMLKKACDRGHAYSCWTMNFDEELVAGETKNSAEMGLKACQHSTNPGHACEFYTAVLEHEIEATPWVMSDRRQAALNQETCWEQDQAKGCRDRAFVWDLGDTPLASEMPGGMIFAAFADAEAGCKKQNAFSCYMMFEFAEKKWPRPDEARVADLKKRVCAKIPEACEIVP